jgi:hypothetical protein
MREVAGTHCSGVAAVEHVPWQSTSLLHELPLLLHLFAKQWSGQSASLRHQLELLLHFFEKQSEDDAHQSPVSTHIFAGWPSAQKSLSPVAEHAVVFQGVQVVFAVVRPRLHEPHGLPGLLIQVSARPRPERSLLEMNWQKSPRWSEVEHDSDEQIAPDSLQ